VFHPGPFGDLVAHFANRQPELYEKRFTWMIPAWFLIFKLRAVTDAG